MYENTYDEIAKTQNGDKIAMDNLVKNNFGLVYTISKRFIGRGYDIEDLNQIGAICRGYENIKLNSADVSGYEKKQTSSQLINDLKLLLA